MVTLIDRFLYPILSRIICALLRLSPVDPHETAEEQRKRRWDND